MKKIIRAVCFCVLTVLALFITYNILAWKDTNGGKGTSLHQLKATGNNLVDAVFVGSSHVYCGIYPEILWRDYGIAAFDMSISAMDKDSAYYYTKHLLKTQSPKYVFVDLYPILYDKQTVIGNIYRNMLSMPLSKNSIDLVNAHVDEEERRDYFLRWPIIHTRYKELTYRDFSADRVDSFGRGEYISFDNKRMYPDFSEALACEEVGELSEKNIKWIDDFVELSRKENFNLVFFVVPFTITYEWQMQINAAVEYANQKGIETIDFNKQIQSLNISAESDFIDGTHLNAWGAEKFSMLLGEMFKDEFEDHRADPTYYLWDEDLNYYNHARNRDLLRIAVSTLGTEELLQFIYTCPNISLIISLDGSFEQSTLPMAEYLKTVGIEDYEDGGTWVQTETGMKKMISNDSTETVYYRLDKKNMLKVIKTDTANLGNLVIGNEKAQSAYNGMTIIAYDTIENEIAGKTGLY